MSACARAGPPCGASGSRRASSAASRATRAASARARCSGALLAFGLAPRAFVATSTATGLLVDAARLPVYLWQAGSELWALPRLPLWIGLATAGVLAGTLVGERVLFGLSPERFRRLVAAAIGALGLWLLVSAA